MGPGGWGPQDGPGPGGALRGRLPTNPLFESLDLNTDGVIDAEEIAKASESLKKLDRNGDGKITRDEARPQRPRGPRRDNGVGSEGAQPQPGPEN